MFATIYAIETEAYFVVLALHGGHLHLSPDQGEEMREEGGEVAAVLFAVQGDIFDHACLALESPVGIVLELEQRLEAGHPLGHMVFEEFWQFHRVERVEDVKDQSDQVEHHHSLSALLCIQRPQQKVTVPVQHRQKRRTRGRNRHHHLSDQLLCRKTETIPTLILDYRYFLNSFFSVCNTTKCVSCVVVCNPPNISYRIERAKYRDEGSPLGVQLDFADDCGGVDEVFSDLPRVAHQQLRVVVLHILLYLQSQRLPLLRRVLLFGTPVFDDGVLEVEGSRETVFEGDLGVGDVGEVSLDICQIQGDCVEINGCYRQSAKKMVSHLA